MKEIITDLDKLSVRSEEVDPIKQSKLVRGVIYNIQEVVKDKDLPCLAGIQIGLPYRIFVINFNGNLRTFINPIIQESKGFTFSRENSPCLPDKNYVVGRFTQIDTMYMNPKGKIENKRLVGYAAYVFQQCMEALEGVTLNDIALEIDEDFDNATEEERAEVLKMWCEVLGDKISDNQAKIDEDKELKKLEDAYSFQNKKAKGEIEVEEFTLTPEEVEEIKKESEEKINNEKESNNE